MTTANVRLNLGVGLETSSRWALASLICAIVGFFTGITFILAIIFGHMGLAEIKQNPSLQGRGMAIAGLAIGYTMIGLAIILIAGEYWYWSHLFQSVQQTGLLLLPR